MEIKAHPIVWAAILAGSAWVGLRWFENAMVFIPSRQMTAHPGSLDLSFDRVWLTADDGVRIRAWWLPGPRPDAPVMLCLHGNGGNLSYRIDKMRIFHDAGAAQLWIDWRGYGESGGVPSEAGLYRDALAARRWLESVKSVPPSRLVLYGESLGCGAAVELALRAPAAGLIIDSGFSSIPDMAKVVLPWFPTALARLRFDNRAKLPRITTPKLFLHSPEDDVIPYRQAQANYEAAAEPKSFVVLQGGHNDGFMESLPTYSAAVRNFLRTAVPPKGG